VNAEKGETFTAELGAGERQRADKPGFTQRLPQQGSLPGGLSGKRGAERLVVPRQLGVHFHYVVNQAPHERLQGGPPGCGSVHGEGARVVAVAPYGQQKPAELRGGAGHAVVQPVRQGGTGGGVRVPKSGILRQKGAQPRP
jgi:hypothetical protein